MKLVMFMSEDSYITIGGGWGLKGYPPQNFLKGSPAIFGCSCMLSFLSFPEVCLELQPLRATLFGPMGTSINDAVGETY